MASNAPKAPTAAVRPVSGRSDTLAAERAMQQRISDDVMRVVHGAQTVLEQRLQHHERLIIERLDRLERMVDALLSRPHEPAPSSAARAAIAGVTPPELDSARHSLSSSDSPAGTPTTVDVLTVTAVVLVDKADQALDTVAGAEAFLCPFVALHTDVMVMTKVHTDVAANNVIEGGKAVGYLGQYGFNNLPGHKHTVFLWRSRRFKCRSKGVLQVELPWKAADGVVTESMSCEFAYAEVTDGLRNAMKLLFIGVNIGKAGSKFLFEAQFKALTDAIDEEFMNVDAPPAEVYFFGDLNLHQVKAFPRAELHMIQRSDFGYCCAPESEKAYRCDAVGMYVGAGTGKHGPVVSVRAEQFEVANSIVMRNCPRHGDPGWNGNSDYPYQVRFTVRAKMQSKWSLQLPREVAAVEPSTLRSGKAPVHRQFTLMAANQLNARQERGQTIDLSVAF